MALFGILLMNIVGFGLPLAYENPNIYGGADGLNLFAWQINALFFEGTMRGLFSVLVGAGVVHAWLFLWTGDILYIYGVAGLFLFVFRKVSPRNLIVLGILVLASVTLKDVYAYAQTSAMYEESQIAQTLLDSGNELSEERQDAIDVWQEEVDGSRPTQEEIDELVAGKKGGYFANIAISAEGIVSRQSYVLYMYTFWDATGMMLIGMALLKLGILNANRSSRFYLSMMAVGYGIGCSVNAYEINLLLNSNFGVLETAKSYLTYDVGRVPVTFGHVGLVMFVCRKGWLNWLTSRIAAVGRMALTSYVTHTVICAFIFFGIGFAMFGELQRYQLYYVVFGIWIFQLIVSPIWLKYYRFGPLEWLWRSLTYNKRHAMKRVM